VREFRVLLCAAEGGSGCLVKDAAEEEMYSRRGGIAVQETKLPKVFERTVESPSPSAAATVVEGPDFPRVAPMSWLVRFTWVVW
jgi:hypothetical protein